MFSTTERADQRPTPSTPPNQNPKCSTDNVFRSCYQEDILGCWYGVSDTWIRDLNPKGKKLITFCLTLFARSPYVYHVVFVGNEFNKVWCDRRMAFAPNVHAEGEPFDEKIRRLDHVCGFALIIPISFSKNFSMC